MQLKKQSDGSAVQTETWSFGKKAYDPPTMTQREGTGEVDLPGGYTHDIGRRARALHGHPGAQDRRVVEGEEGAAVTPLRGAMLGLVALASGCQPGPSTAAPSPRPIPPAPSNPGEPAAMTAHPPCRAILTPSAAAEYGIRFELTNPTARPIALDIDEPFLQFHVRAAAGGAALAVVQPALDIPINPTTVTVPAAGTLPLASPVRLRFGAPSRDGFVWSIDHTKAGVELTFTLDLPAPFDQPFTARL